MKKSKSFELMGVVVKSAAVGLLFAVLCIRSVL